MKVRFRRHRWKGEYRGENERFAPLIKLPEGLGESWFPSLFRGVQRGFPSGKPGRQRSAKLVWQSRCQTWQDKPRRGGVRWITKKSILHILYGRWAKRRCFDIFSRHFGKTNWSSCWYNFATVWRWFYTSALETVRLCSYNCDFTNFLFLHWLKNTWTGWFLLNNVVWWHSHARSCERAGLLETW